MATKSNMPKASDVKNVTTRREFRILGVDFINNVKTGNKFFALKVEGIDQNIVRSVKAFLTDLRNSALIGDDVTDVNDARVLKLRRNLKNGVLSGDMEIYKAGSHYIADENSSAVRNEIAKPGDVLVREKDGVRVDGFLDFTVNARTLLNQEIAESVANTVSGMFAGVSMATPAIEEIHQLAEKASTTV